MFEVFLFFKFFMKTVSNQYSFRGYDGEMVENIPVVDLVKGLGRCSHVVLIKSALKEDRIISESIACVLTGDDITPFLKGVSVRNKILSCL